MLKSLQIFFSFLILSQYIFAQDKCPAKFEKIKLTDFTDVYSGVDSTAGAIIVADLGSTIFDGNNKEYFSLIFKRFTRIRFNNSSAFDLATVSIPLVKNNDNDEEKLLKLEAYTYNVENGQIVKSKLKNEDIVKDKKSRSLVYQKFTMPNVKVGSIIEFEYTIQSDFLRNLQPWIFQTNYPTVWSEYEVAIPSFFMYKEITQGYLPYFINKVSTSNANYTVKIRPQGVADSYLRKSQEVTLNSDDNIHRWVVKNAPVVKSEKYTASLKNHFQAIQFQHTGTKYPNSVYSAALDEWSAVGNLLINSSSFGNDVFKKSDWMADEIKNIVSESDNALNKAKKIFNYVKSNYKCNNKDYGIYLTTNLNDVSKKKQGSIADVNILLASLLAYNNIEVKLGILSTRWHGRAYRYIPVLHNYNYVICDVFIDDKQYFLDASSPINGFNKLPLECYNDFAISFGNSGFNSFTFSTNTLTETKSSIINIELADQDANKWKGNISSTLGYYESESLRTLELKKGEGEVKNEIAKKFQFPYEINNFELIGLKNYDETAVVNYNFTVENAGDKAEIFLKPLILEGTINNYFNSDERSYPVEMPYKINENILVIIQVPPGYKLDQKPESIRIKMSDGQAVFNYTVDAKEDVITIGTNIKFNQANFSVDDYQDLKALMDIVVKKHLEQLVFKKK